MGTEDECVQPEFVGSSPAPSHLAKDPSPEKDPKKTLPITTKKKLPDEPSASPTAKKQKTTTVDSDAPPNNLDTVAEEVMDLQENLEQKGSAENDPTVDSNAPPNNLDTVAEEVDLQENLKQKGSADHDKADGHDQGTDVFEEDNRPSSVKGTFKDRLV